MPEQQLPEGDEFSVNSNIAYDNLRQQLPLNWDISSIHDYLSGNEYGQDWLVSLKNEKNQVEGQEFRVQSKAIQSKKKLKSRKVSTDMKVSTLNGLRRVPVPVMLHFFDKNAQRGYWMWLDDWYDAHYSPRMEKRKEVPVDIPRKNELNEGAIDRIRRYIAFWHKRSVLLKQAAAASARDPHYDYRTSFSSHSMSVEVYPKHLNAPPINFSITPTKFDTDAFRQLEERGETISFRGLMHCESKLPQFVTPPDQEVELTLFRVVGDVRFPASIEFVSTNREHNYKIHYVQFRLTVDGTQYRRFEGEALHGHLLCTIEVDIPNHIISFSIQHNPKNKAIRSFVTFFEFRKHSHTFDQMQLTMLEPYGTANSKINQGVFPEFSPQEALSHRLVKAMTTIEDFAKVTFGMPKTVSPQLVEFVEGIAEIVSTGYTSKPIGEVNSFPKDRILVVTTDYLTADKMRNALKEQPTFACWYIFPEPTTAKVFKRTITLGTGAYIFTVKKILNFEDFPTELTEENKANDISFPVEVEWSETITAYRDWLPSDTPLKIDWLRFKSVDET